MELKTVAGEDEKREVPWTILVTVQLLKRPPTASATDQARALPRYRCSTNSIDSDGLLEQGRSHLPLLRNQLFPGREGNRYVEGEVFLTRRVS